MIFALCVISALTSATPDPQDSVRRAVTTVVQPLIERYHIPGMAIGVAVSGRSYVFNYGVASNQTRDPVTNDTLFELGSISKTLTATLTSYAQVRNYLSLSDTVGKYLPAVRGREFGDVTLLELGTHTPGGLPLQVPGDVRNDDELMQYLAQWRHTYPPGTYRTYTNIGIGTLGLITAESMGASFDALIERDIFAPIGMKNSYVDVPQAKMANYAQGYTQDGSAIRMAPGTLWSEAYGVRATAADVLRFLEANMNMISLDPKLQRALIETHTAYFKAGALTQDLIWEQYAYPVALKTLLAGNSSAMLFDPTPAVKITPPAETGGDVWINKTGSTNGFSAYAAFIPKKRFGIVMLANRSFPIPDRVVAAYNIATALSP
jgi:beta-lactamase class C